MRRAYPGKRMAATGLDDLPGWAQDLIGTAPVARLGLLDAEGAPRVLPITFALWEGALVSAVDHKPKRVEAGELARVRWLRSWPEAAITVDRYDDDWSRLAWVQALGEAEVLDEPPAAALDALVVKYAQYRERRPGGPLIRLAPRRFVCWSA